VRVTGDVHYLTAVMNSMLENAARWSPETGEVRLRIESDSDGVGLCVTSELEGIDPARVGDVFDVFSQRRVQGQTVGVDVSMAMARAIVRAHGGELRIEAGGDNRAVCSAWLPNLRAASQPVCDEAPDPAAEPAGQGTGGDARGEGR
jgi:two-component system sensor histidine kinase KdpD